MHCNNNNYTVKTVILESEMAVTSNKFCFWSLESSYVSCQVGTDWTDIVYSCSLLLLTNLTNSDVKCLTDWIINLSSLSATEINLPLTHTDSLLVSYSKASCILLQQEYDKDVKGCVYCLEGSSQTVKMQLPKNAKESRKLLNPLCFIFALVATIL